MFTNKKFPVLLLSSGFLFIAILLQYMGSGIQLYEGFMICSVLITLFVRHDKYTYITGITASLLLLIFAFIPSGGLPKPDMLQYLLPFTIIIVITLLVVYLKALYRTIEGEKSQVIALFEHATEGIILTNNKGVIILANPAAQKLFGYEKSELLGMSVEQLIPQRFQNKHVHYRNDYYKHPSNREMGKGRDLYAIRKSGKEFPVEVSLSHFKQNKQEFIIAFVIDITRRKENEQALLKQKEQLAIVTADILKLNSELEAKVEERTLILKEALHELEKSQKELSEALNKEKELNEMKSRFVSMASHEFKTPLSAVLSSASLLSRYKQSSEQENRDKHIARIKNSVKHLNDLLEDFLLYGKLEDGHVLANITSFDVQLFVLDVIDEINPLLKSGQQINLSLQGGNSFVTDSRLLKNIILNLLSNSIKFSDESKLIELTVIVNEEEMEVIVKDSGIGIAEEDKKDLFNSFYRGRNAINIQGTGLGLNIVQRYIDLLQGSIKVESTLGKGSVFSVYLPILQ